MSAASELRSVARAQQRYALLFIGRAQDQPRAELGQDATVLDEIRRPASACCQNSYAVLGTVQHDCAEVSRELRPEVCQLRYHQHDVRFSASAACHAPIELLSNNLNHSLHVRYIVWVNRPLEHMRHREQLV